jgi:hypothetical protein
MCWTRTDQRVEEMQTEKFATKKDEGEAFRTGRVTDTPKPLPDEQPKKMELADS